MSCLLGECVRLFQVFRFTCRFFCTSNFSTSLSSFNSACVSSLLFALFLLIVPPPPLQHTYSLFCSTLFCSSVKKCKRERLRSVTW